MFFFHFLNSECCEKCFGFNMTCVSFFFFYLIYVYVWLVFYIFGIIFIHRYGDFVIDRIFFPPITKDARRIQNVQTSIHIKKKNYNFIKLFCFVSISLPSETRIKINRFVFIQTVHTLYFRACCWISDTFEIIR